jgi:8-oxo-dGTP diphosphatase
MTNLNFEHPYTATDMILFRIIKDNKQRGKTEFDLQVLLVDKVMDDGTTELSLPGGFIGMDESLEENVMRKLKKKTGLSGAFYIEQLYTKSDVNRDSRARIISCSYLGISRDDTIEGELLPEAKWHSVKKHNELNLAFDHEEIITYALDRMAGKVGYTDIAFAFLPEYFTLYELESVYEILLKRPISNFRRKMNPFITETDQIETGLARRPAKLYQRNETQIQW